MANSKDKPKPKQKPKASPRKASPSPSKKSGNTTPRNTQASPKKQSPAAKQSPQQQKAANQAGVVRNETRVEAAKQNAGVPSPKATQKPEAIELQDIMRLIKSSKETFMAEFHGAVRDRQMVYHTTMQDVLNLHNDYLVELYNVVKDPENPYTALVDSVVFAFFFTLDEQLTPNYTAKDLVFIMLQDPDKWKDKVQKFDTSKVPYSKMARLKPLVDREDCQPKNAAKCCRAIWALSRWMRAICGTHDENLPPQFAAAEHLIVRGLQALEKQDFATVRGVNKELYMMMPDFLV